MLSKQLQDKINRVFEEEFRSELPVENLKPVVGGSINNCFYLEHEGHPWFIKINRSGHCPGMFEKEFNGLRLLHDKGIRVPAPQFFYADSEDQFLLMEWLEPGRSVEFMQEIGFMLSALHKIKSENFGLHEDNYIGRLQQVNSPRSDWKDFFSEIRIEPLFKSAFDKGVFGSPQRKNLDRLFIAFDNVIPHCRPTLLHGDLWHGNVYCGKSGAYLVDPAVYFGHPEMDLAMTKLFGGFDKRFYESYGTLIAVEKGWEARAPIHNLYPLLVHLELFGIGYAADIKQTLSKF